MLINEIRNQFPTLQKRINGKKLIYFDNACSVLKPKPVIEAILNYYQNLGACAGGRSTHLLSQKVEELCEEAREKVKNFIGAKSSKEIIWTKNTTEGINLIARTFPFKNSKNEVITTNLEHHSNLLPFFEEAKKGRIKLKILNAKTDGSIDLDKLEKLISSKTALISITHTSNVLGNTLPVGEMAKLAHKKNALILVDDAQYIATHQEDVQKSDIDFLVFSGHKIGGPTGIGALYGKEELLKKLNPFNVGGGTVERVWIEKSQLKAKYLPIPRKFEAGVQHYAGIIGLGAAVDFIQKIGYQQISEQISFLRNYLLSKLLVIPQVEILGKPESSIVSFKFKSREHFALDFNIYLNHNVKDYIIAIRCGHHCAMPIHQYFGVSHSLRASFFVYNTKEEINIFLKAFCKFLNKN